MFNGARPLGLASLGGNNFDRTSKINARALRAPARQLEITCAGRVRVRTLSCADALPPSLLQTRSARRENSPSRFPASAARTLLQRHSAVSATHGNLARNRPDARTASPR